MPSTDPQLGMNFVLFEELTLQQFPREEIIVDSFCDDLGDLKMLELDEAVVFRLSGPLTSR